MTAEALDTIFRAHRKTVWAIVYRMTGSREDADDLTQDTFMKAISAPPEGELRPWLTRTAVNAGIDLLRARKRRGYVGPWLPEPIDTGDEHAAPPERDAAQRYDLLESASFAFLVALEALSPKARAVLLLRDVFDYSVREVATPLSMTEAHVKVTHHRARSVMKRYDAVRAVPTRDLQAQTRDALAALMTALVTGDIAACESLLAEDVVTLNDSAGEYTAARVPVVGRSKCALFWMKVTQHPNVRAELRMLNGLPALVATLPSPPPRIAPRTALIIHLDASGLICQIHGIVAPEKLARLLPHASPS